MFEDQLCQALSSKSDVGGTVGQHARKVKFLWGYPYTTFIIVNMYT